MQWEAMSCALLKDSYPHKSFTLDAVIQANHGRGDRWWKTWQKKKRKEKFTTRIRLRGKTDFLQQVKIQKWHHKRDRLAFFLARPSSAACWLSSVFTCKTSSSPPFHSGGGERTRKHIRQKAHGNWCSFLTALVQLQWVCHTESEEDRKLMQIYCRSMLPSLWSCALCATRQSVRGGLVCNASYKLVWLMGCCWGGVAFCGL